MSVGAGVYIKQETDYVNTVPEQGCACPRSTRESVLFIGTQFSILYTSMYSLVEAATPRA
jgi:hypothetical protein